MTESGQNKLVDDLRHAGESWANNVNFGIGTIVAKEESLYWRAANEIDRLQAALKCVERLGGYLPKYSL